MSSGPIFYESEARAIRRDSSAGVRQAGTRQARPPTAGPRLHRRRRSADPMHIDPNIVPPGMSYEWKAMSIFGAPVAGHWTNLRENHWRPVPADRHPDLATEGENIIVRAGTVLCERPSYLTDEARLEDIQEALGPVMATEDLLFGTPVGQLPRDTPSTRQRSHITRDYGPPGAGEEPGHEGVMYSEP